MYSDFALIYDRLMQDIPYAGWVKYLGRVFEKHGIKPADILDVGCGTGNVTIPLAEMGYRLTGLDMSAEMLAAAEEKARTKGLQINWIQQDMRSMDLGGLKFDLVTSMTDSLNYLQTPSDLQKVFEQIGGLLKTGGWFAFDLNSGYKLREVFGNNVFTLLDDDIAYVWENSYYPDTHSCSMHLTFFVKEKDGRYRRFSEEHSETGFETDEVSTKLIDAGFAVKGVYRENSFKEPQRDTERIYFIAQRE
ncbi:MAG: class I SAM-dependent DNA methyltransferase [Eubacteriales bacterium]